MVERRRFARIPVNIMLKFKSLEAFENALTGSACDLSRGGICIKTDQVKSVGTKVQIELPVPGGEPVLVQGVVRSIRYRDGKPWAMGIEFEELEEPALGVINWLIMKHEKEGR